MRPLVQSPTKLFESGSDDCRARSLLCSGRPRPFGNQPRASLSGQIGPQPLDLNPEPVLKLWQRQHVQPDPHQPGQKAAAAHMTGLEDREVLADHRHVALVEVPKWSTILACADPVGDDLPDKSPLLNRCL